MRELRPYQMDLYQRVRAVRAQGKRRIVVQAATGAGKTDWGAFVCKQALAKGSRVLWMVHRRQLVDQISERLGLWQVPHAVLMRGQQGNTEAAIQVASRDTLLSRCLNNEWLGLPPAQLVLVDEAHHAADPQSEYRRIIQQYPEATLLLLTATPVGPDGQGMGPWAEAIECAAPTSQLVRDGYLMPVQVFAPDRKMKGRKYVKGISGSLVESWQQFADGRPTVLFCSRVQHSLDAVECFRAAGISAKHVDANTPDDERDRIFEDVAYGSVTVLSNVGIVGEGIDLPELSCCQFFCEVGSRVRWLQGCGRVMRPSPGKTHGIIIDHSGAVFRHGFPDEDSDWPLVGSPDELWEQKHPKGAQVFWCSACEIAYRGQEHCPECGRKPKKPPPSIFAPPQAVHNELLSEAERQQAAQANSREVRIKTWLACLGMAANRDGTFGMAGAVYKRKYGCFPDRDFPCVPSWGGWKQKVAEVHPGFGRKKRQSLISEETR